MYTCLRFARITIALHASLGAESFGPSGFQVVTFETDRYRTICRSVDRERESHHWSSGAGKHRRENSTIPPALHSILITITIARNQKSYGGRPPFGERSLSLRDRYSNLDGRPSLNPIKPRLETWELIKALNPGKLVTSNPVKLS